MKKRQLNVTVSQATMQQVYEIQRLTSESQASLVIRLVAEEYGRLIKQEKDKE